MDTDYRHVLLEQQSGVLVLTINVKEMSDYDVCTAIGRELVDAISQAHSSAVVIDLHNVEFIASVGIVPFLNAKRCVGQQQGHLVLCHLSDFVNQVFATTRLLITPDSQNSVFEFATTRDEAIEMLQK